MVTYFNLIKADNTIILEDMGENVITLSLEDAHELVQELAAIGITAIPVKRNLSDL